MNQKSPVRRGSSRGRDSALESDCSTSVLLNMFQGVAAGLPPSMSTEMFQTSIQSIKQLAARLTTFFKHGLATNQVSISLVLVRQFSFHRNYPLALASSLSELAGQKTCLTPSLVDLIILVLAELGPAKNLVTSPLVDMILQWTLPQMNKKQEVNHALLALKLVQTAGGFIWTDSKYSFQFVYHQIRTRLLSFSKTDTSQAAHYGLLCYEAKSVLLDILIAMSRLQDTELEGDMPDFYLEPRLVISPAGKAEENNNLLGVKAVTTGDGPEEGCEGATSSYYCGQQGSVVTGAVKLLTPKMIEDNVTSSKSTVCLQNKYEIYSTSPNIETEEQQEDVVVEDEDVLSIYQNDGAGDVLGFLISPDGDVQHEVSNYSCIGRDPRCSVILEGRDVSRLHARLAVKEGSVCLESLGLTCHVRINDQVVQFGEAMEVSEGDTIVLGRQTFSWHK